MVQAASGRQLLTGCPWRLPFVLRLQPGPWLLLRFSRVRLCLLACSLYGSQVEESTT